MRRAVVHDSYGKVRRGSPQYLAQRLLDPLVDVASPRQAKGLIDDDKATLQDLDPGEIEKMGTVDHAMVFMVPQRGINPGFRPQPPEQRCVAADIENCSVNLCSRSPANKRKSGWSLRFILPMIFSISRGSVPSPGYSINPRPARSLNGRFLPICPEFRSGIHSP